MRRLAALVALGATLCAAPAFAKSPAWDRKELRGFFAQIQSAARAPSVAAKDMGIARVAGAAYRVAPRGGEATEVYAKRVLRARSPGHPSVKQGQWLLALTRQLYVDLSERCRLVSRFERKRADRQYFEQMSAQTQQVAAQLGGQIELVVEGLDQATEPLPAVGGEAPTDVGVLAHVHDGGVVTIQRLDRARFVGHQPPETHPRTAKGAIKELYSSQKQFNTFAQTMGKYDRAHREAYGHVQLLLPASYPAIYLNEVARGGVEAGMHTLHLKTMTKRGELREILVALAKQKKKRGRRAEKLVPVECEDSLPMTKCAKKIARAAKKGRPFLQLQ